MIMTEETYKYMKKLVLEYEQEQINGKVITEEKPYIRDYKIDTELYYNPNYGDNRECVCGHPYYRHFDPYENNEAVGCKYCECWQFEEKIDILKLRKDKINKIFKKQQE